MRKFVLAGFALLVIATPTHALADDFVFTVPIRIENAPSVSQANIRCDVRYAAGGRPTGVGEAQTWVTVTDGRYVGNVTLTVTPPAEVRREELWRWSCSLNLRYAGDHYTGGQTEETARIRYTAETGQAVASSQMRVQADFPRP